MPRKTKETEINATVETNVEDTITSDEATQKVKLSKEDREALKKLSDKKYVIKYIVDQYYQSQEYRIRAQNQARSLVQGYDISDQEHALFISRNLQIAENQEALNKEYLDVLTKEIPICRWMRSIKGIGPIMSAYLYSVFDIEKARYATNFLSYAGLNDNNNPWLGTEKAKSMVKSVLAERDEKIKELTDYMDSIGVTKTQKSAISKLHKNGTLDQDTLLKVFKLLPGSEEAEYFSGTTFILFDEYLNTLKHSNYVGDYTFAKVAEITKRDVANIKRGVIANNERSKNPKSYVSSDDLSSYLAKPPYNTELKKQMYIIGDMFIKNQNRGSLYGEIYKSRLMYEENNNERGFYAEQANKLLESKNWDKKTDTYKCLCEGKLSKSHLVARARRYAVKLFISHVHEAMYYAEYHEEYPQHYCLVHQGHHDYIAPEVDYKKFLD